MTVISELRIDTIESERIIKRLTNHWRHKLTIEQKEKISVIHFSTDIRALLEATSSSLLATIEASDQEQLGQYENVVLNHLNRMANQDFPNHWIRIDK